MAPIRRSERSTSHDGRPRSAAPHVSHDVKRPAPRPTWFRDAFWRTAPRVLLRYPALFAAVLAATTLLVFAAAAYPLFLSATSSEIVTAAVGRPHITRYGGGITYRFDNLPLEPVPLTPSRFFPAAPGTPSSSPEIGTADAAARELLAGDPTLGEPIAAVLGDPVKISGSGEGVAVGRLLGASHVIEHVEHLAGAGGDGVWIQGWIAEVLGVEPGDTITLADPSRDRGAVEVEVDGIYRDIYFAWPTDGYWLQWQDEFRLESVNSDIPPPPHGTAEQGAAER